MKFSQLQKILRTLEKPFYTTSELERITGSGKNVLTVTLGRFCKKNLLIRITKGVFALPENMDKLPEIANQLYIPSYLSFESALSRFGILSQSPYTLTFATINRSKKIILADNEVEYRQIKPEFFAGFSKEGALFVASPEKALLDQLYLVTKGKASITLEELDLSEISKRNLAKLAKNFPFTTQKLAKKLTKS